MTVRLPIVLCLTCLSSSAALAGDAMSSNLAPLKAQPYYRLPLGCVKARSWLNHQLELQRDGLTGHAEELYNDIGESDWISDRKRGGQHAWERGPYYAKGLITLAYVLDDQALKDRAQKWIDRVLTSQRENGDFGPKDRNWWPNMIALHYLRDYYEATGDERVPPFFEKYFRFQLDMLPEHPLHKESGWAKARGGDNLAIETTVAETMPAQPFKAADAPVRLQLKALKTDLGDWGKCREDFPARAVELPQSPVEVTGDVETITLVPYGSTEIRITQFPWVKK